jgi:hypothetical protein
MIKLSGRFKKFGAIIKINVMKEKYMAMIQFEKEASVKKVLEWKYPFFSNKEIVVQKDDKRIPPPKHVLEMANKKKKLQSPVKRL